MEVVFTTKALEHIEWWKASGNRKVQKKIMELVADIQIQPFTGLGKPEPLKHNFTGCYSRRINAEHRLIYRVSENTLTILTLKGHYENS